MTCSDENTHIMLDLETLSTAPDAAIVSIGAQVFYPVAGGLGAAFYACIQPEGWKGHIDPKTVAWWLQQSDRARCEVVSGTMQTLEHALLDFSAWVLRTSYNGSTSNPVYIWANSPAFDCVILRSAYHRVGLKEPWSFRNERCYRTIRALNPRVQGPSDTGCAHNALDDAKWQAAHLLRLMGHEDSHAG